MKIYTVIKITESKVYLGKDDGEFIELDIEHFPFKLIHGDKVNYFSNEQGYFIEPIIESNDDFVLPEHEIDFRKNVTSMLPLIISILWLLYKCSR